METMLNYAQAAAILGVKVDTLQRWAASRRIDRIKLPNGSVKFTETILRDFVNAHRESAKPETKRRPDVRPAARSVRNSSLQSVGR